MSEGEWQTATRRRRHRRQGGGKAGVSGVEVELYPLSAPPVSSFSHLNRRIPFFSDLNIDVILAYGLGKISRVYAANIQYQWVKALATHLSANLLLFDPVFSTSEKNALGPLFHEHLYPFNVLEINNNWKSIAIVAVHLCAELYAELLVFGTTLKSRGIEIIILGNPPPASLAPHYQQAGVDWGEWDEVFHQTVALK